jgi:copper chaperone CopZ
MITRVRIAGMSCQHCVRAVFTALTPVAGIISADVSIGAATIEHDGRVTMDTLRDAVAVAGYAVEEGTEERRRLPLL